ncbi:hypothetical protein FNV43_RR09765 [Rhamnella rubrinervis]|uniref:glutathione transferase n=1 Tax=Rhamnella rubrinervis TaxID=2594499 RepID=A0A8K0HAJ9_9ROSA|nr:hypothetical protein FNV43_RR09765 [Rhamnella rubrinervis]
MAEESVKLYGVWVSPFSRRVEIALKLKGVDYEYSEEDLANKSPLLLKYNPVYKKVPTFLHNGKPLAESLVILEYIDETWTNSPLLPNNPYQTAQARFWARFIDDKCIPSLWKALWAREDQEKAVEEAKEYLQFLENEVKDKKFFGGETVGLVDIAGDFIAFWVPTIQEAVGVKILSEEEFPKLCQWSHEFANHSLVKEKLPPKDELLAFFKSRHF